jgi:tRNA(Ile)-lysidine synthase
LETLLMRLIRGASVTGLGGMAWRRRLRGAPAVLIRPMLGVDRRAAVGFLQDMGQPWREDPTNTDISRWRAKLRMQVLPVLRQLRPGAAIKACEAADHLRQVAALLRRAARRAARRHVRVEGAVARLDRGRARRMAPPLLGAVVRRVALEWGVAADALSARIVHRIVRAAGDSSGRLRQFELAGAVRVVVTDQDVRWERKDPVK